jgi:uncharacterized membrane protein
VTYEGWVANAVRVVESVGGALMVGGALVVLVQFALGFVRGRPDSYAHLRVGLARVVQVGLEILILGDVLRTIVETPTLVEALSLTMIVIVRLLLSVGLQVELGGLSWQRRSAGKALGAESPSSSEQPGGR